MLLAGVLAALCSPLRANDQEPVTLEVGAAEPAGGSDLRLPVLLQCPAGRSVSALQFDLLYNPRLASLRSVQPGETAMRGGKQLVSKAVAAEETFRGNVSEPQYLAMRKPKTGPAGGSPAGESVRNETGRERVVIVGLNSRALDSGVVAWVTLRSGDGPGSAPALLQLAHVSMAGPDAKAVPFRIKGGESGAESRKTGRPAAEKE